MRMETPITPTSSFPASFSSAVTSSFDSPIVSSSSFVTEGMWEIQRKWVHSYYNLIAMLCT